MGLRPRLSSAGTLRTSEIVEGCGDGSAKAWAHLSLQASELETFSPEIQIV